MAQASVLTDDGLEFITDVLDCGAGQVTLPTDLYVAWGTGTNDPAVTDTALQTEASESRVTVTSTQPSATSNLYVGTITATGSKTITEAGLFTASSSGTLIMRVEHTGVSVTSGQKIQYAFYIDHGRP